MKRARRGGTGWRGLVGVDGLGTPSVRVGCLEGSNEDGGHAPQVDSASGEQPQVGHSLADLVVKHRLTGRPAAASLQGRDVLVRRVVLPSMRRSEIHSALALEARKHVGYPIEEGEVRYEILGRTERGATDASIDLLMAVAPRKAVEAARAELIRGGLHPVSLVPRSVALRALLRAHGPIEVEETVAYLEMRETESHLTICRGEEIRFTRTFGIGRGAFVDALRAIVVPGRGTLSLTPEDAERLLTDHGVLHDKGEGHVGGIPSTAVTIMLRPLLERLARELWNSFDYIHEQSLGQGVDRGVVFGEGARIPHLSEYLTGVLKLPVAPEAPQDSGIRWDLVSGLCRLEPGSLNFLAPAETSLAYRIAEAIPQRIALGAAAVLVLSISLPAEVSVFHERQRVAALRAEVAAIAPRVAAIGTFRAARGAEARSRDLMERLSERPILWSAAMRDLSHRVGEDVRLTSFVVVEETEAPQAVPESAGGAQITPAREVEIAGVLRPGPSGPERTLGLLMGSLACSPYLRDVRLMSCQTDLDGSRFTLRAALADPGGGS